jgi:hypothetical protein
VVARRSALGGYCEPSAGAHSCQGSLHEHLSGHRPVTSVSTTSIRVRAHIADSNGIGTELAERIDGRSSAGSLGQEPVAIAITGSKEEVVEQPETVASRQTETLRVRREGLGHNARVVDDAVEDLRRDPGDGVGVDSVLEQLADDPARPRDREPTEDQPSVGPNTPSMDADVRPSGLTPSGHGELVNVGSQVADTVHRRRRRVGDDRNIGIVESLPRRMPRVELKPGRAKREVIWLGSATESVDPVGDSFQKPCLNLAHKGLPRNVYSSGLLQGDEAPLSLGNVA